MIRLCLVIKERSGQCVRPRNVTETKHRMMNKTHLSNTASVSERNNCIIATISSLLDLEAMFCFCNSVFLSLSRFNSPSRMRTSSRNLPRSSAPASNAPVDSGNVDSSQVMAFGLVLSVTENCREPRHGVN